MKKSPNFIIGGTAAGGTSFLYDVLAQHREIFLPKQRIPEPHYYYKSWEYAKGLEWYLEFYFSKVSLEKIAVGERSSSYLYGGNSVASKIYRDFPSMKFIFMLRNPIERAWANYRFTVLQGYESLSFYDALREEKQRVANAKGIWSEIQPYDYTGRSFYARQLKEFLTFFPKNQILCIKSEDISNSDFTLLHKIYTFLEVKDVDFIPHPVSNHTSLSVADPLLQTQLREYFGNEFTYLVDYIRRERDVAEIKGHWDRKKLEALKGNLSTTKEEMPKECRKILHETLAEDMLELKEYVEFDMSDWLAGGGGIFS